MDSAYRDELRRRTNDVSQANPQSWDHLGEFPWLTGALGDPHSGIWFVAENPSLGRIERVRDPNGGPPTEEAQWWASRGDRLFRELLVKHGFKSTPPEQHGGWRCYITNAIKEADYAQNWRGSPAERRRRAAQTWAPVLEWEMKQSRPRLVVALGKTVRDVLSEISRGGIRFPRIETVQSYAYVALRPRGTQGPMHPERVREYDDEFGRIASIFHDLSTAGGAA
jgi:hypothetical protein